MRRPRTPLKLSESIHHQLNAYALAATAAGVGMLALAQPAEGEVVYTRANEVIPPNSIYNLRLNHKNTDFTLVNVDRCPKSSSCYFSVLQQPAPGNGAMGYILDLGYKASVFDLALPRGSRIGPARHFYAEAKLAAGFWSFCEGWALGPWAYATDRYLGLKFKIKGKTHYGWARLSLAEGNEGSGFTATLTGYAYETIPNKAIITGKTKGPDVITVQAATLGHLAAGASAIPAWRRANQ
jgi:hypothetical protein